MKVKARVIVQSGEKVLLGLRRDGQWELPGGKVERETVLKGALRELREETGISPVNVPVVIGCVDQQREKKFEVDIVFHVKGEGEPKVEPRELAHLKWGWYGQGTAPFDEMTPVTRQALTLVWSKK